MVLRFTPSQISGFSRYEDALDEQLIDLMRLGDQKALETLMRRYRGMVWKVVKTYLGSINDAEDLLQEIFLSLHQNKDSFYAGSAKFSSWLYRVAVNRCLDILKSSRGRTSHTEIYDEIPDQHLSAEAQMEKSQLAEQIGQMLESLPAQQKLALSHYYYDSMDVTEIGERLSLTESAVRALIKRGKEKLRHLSEGSSFF